MLVPNHLSLIGRSFSMSILGVVLLSRMRPAVLYVSKLVFTAPLILLSTELLNLAIRGQRRLGKSVLAQVLIEMSIGIL